MWKIYHPEGRNEINELHLPVGEPVVLTIGSQDVIHNFSVPDFKIKIDAVPGRFTKIWFKPLTVGNYWLLCSQYCGTNHSLMRGKVIVMQPGDFKNWLNSPNTNEKNLVVTGEEKFKQLGCPSCHSFYSGPAPLAPRLDGMYGKRQQLQDGSSVFVDDNYLRESITDPKNKITKGFLPVMPSFRGKVSEEDLVALIAYIKSLTPQPEKND